MADYEGILIAGEVLDGKVTTVTRELLNIGRKLGDSLSQPVSSLFLGSNVQEAAKEAITLGADKSYTASGPSPDQLHPDFNAEVLATTSEQIIHPEKFFILTQLQVFTFLRRRIMVGLLPFY